MTWQTAGRGQDPLCLRDLGSHPKRGGTHSSHTLYPCVEAQDPGHLPVQQWQGEPQSVSQNSLSRDRWPPAKCAGARVVLRPLKGASRVRQPSAASGHSTGPRVLHPHHHPPLPHGDTPPGRAPAPPTSPLTLPSRPDPDLLCKAQANIS